MKKLLRLLVAAACTLQPLPSANAESGWTTVVRDNNRQVQIDRASIIQSDAGTKVAWARMVLTPTEAVASGYATVQALNRYDCFNRSFVTVKRRYLDARNIIVREEGVASQRPIPVTRNGVDDRLWQEVCRPPSLGDLEQVAREADRVAALLGGAAREESAVPDRVAVSLPAVSAEVPPSSTERAPVQERAVMPHTTKKPEPPPSSAQPPLRERRAQADSSAATRKASAVTQMPSAVAQWSYEGKTGPAHWGELRAEWALCKDGRRQSPVDLRDGIAVDLEPVQFDYRPTYFRTTDTGLMLQVHVGEGMSARIRGVRYELVFFTLHHPAQEQMDGRTQDMSVHLHHRAADGSMAVVVVLLSAGGQPHPAIQALLNNLPLDRGSDYTPEATIDLASFLPASPAHYLYTGSLTSPPCTEGVMHVVMKEPLQMAREQLAIVARLHPANSRPPQPVQGRLILESR